VNICRLFVDKIARGCKCWITHVRLCTLVALTAAWTVAYPLFAAPPLIARFDPLALTPGKTVELTLHGQSLQGARQLWTTFAARCEFLPPAAEGAQKGEQLLCRVTVPRDAQVGIGAMRLVTGEGISNPQLVMLDDLPTTSETSNNHKIGEAQAIAAPAAIDGQCDAVQEDLFRFHATAGQRLAFEVVSQRLGSNLDPLLRLLTADGEEIVQLDDTEGVAGDCRLAHTFTESGDYLLALRDVRYAGGADYRYRLRIGSFPLIRAAFPAGGRSGEVVSFEPNDAELDIPEPLHVTLPEVTGSPRLVSFGVPSKTGAGSGWFQAEVNPGDESLEVEPNDSSTEATAAKFPGALNGRLDKPGDHDHFKFHAKKGQRVHCIAKTRDLGSPCDLYLSLHRTDGAQIALARQDRQTVLDAEIPEDGEYVLHVEDLAVGGDAAAHVYRIDVSEAYAGFSLTTEHTQYTAPQGGTVVVKVLAQRRGYNGPIELAVDGLGDSPALEGNTFEGGETLLKITVPKNIAQGDFRLAKIVGKAKIGEHSATVAASLREPLQAFFPNAVSLPTDLENTVAIGIGPPFPPFFDLSLAASPIYFPQLIGEASFEVNISRTNDNFKGPVSLIVEGLPAGITADAKLVDDGTKLLRVTLKGPADLAEQELPIRITGWGKFQEQTRTVILESIKLAIVKPLVVSVVLPAPIVAGQEQPATVRLQRFGNEPQPVQLQVTSAPDGILAPISVSIPPETNEVKLSLAAATTAAPGKFENLIITASTTVNGQTVTVESSPTTVEIQAAEPELINAD
jgi:hypothetical protein